MDDLGLMGGMDGKGHLLDEGQCVRDACFERALVRRHIAGILRCASCLQVECERVALHVSHRDPIGLAVAARLEDRTEPDVVESRRESGLKLKAAQIDIRPRFEAAHDLQRDVAAESLVFGQPHVSLPTCAELAQERVRTDASRLVLGTTRSSVVVILRGQKSRILPLDVRLEPGEARLVVRDGPNPSRDLIVRDRVQ
jgi:hypothetical protein